MASELNTRDLFLRILNPKVSTQLTRDLFYNLDHPYFDTRKTFTTLVEKQDHINSKCAKYADDFSAILRQLATEIRLAIRLLRYQDWNCDILRDALQTLHYQLYDFFGPIAQLLYSKCNQRTGDIYEGSQTVGVVGTACRNFFVDAELAFYAFINNLASGKVSYLEPWRTWQELFAEFRTLAAARGAHRIPTTTFTELVLQNMADNLSKTIQNTSQIRATEYIESILVEQRKGRGIGTSPSREPPGVPRCLVIVFDKQSGIVTTGATQPAYEAKNFTWLKGVLKQIHGLRIGETFLRAVHLCSSNVWQLVSELRIQEGSLTPNRIWSIDDTSTTRIYDNFMNATREHLTLSTMPEPRDRQALSQDPIVLRFLQREREGYEAIPRSDSGIFCWAIDTKTFQFKPPCVRCQRMYSEWALHNAPRNTESKKAALKDMTGRTIAYNSNLETCSYCAETTAAAKLYLLRNGKMALS